MSSAQRDGRQVSLIMVDVDHFKQFNDRFGHDAGDLVLKAVAQALMDMAGDGILPCRLGGEEFVLLCPDTPADTALVQADRLRAALAAVRIVHAGLDLPPVTASCGIAAMPTHGTRVDDVLAAADRALYRAKGAGRDCSVIAPDTGAP
jgi:diguanylate cyclase (GGDEF)-like protein